MNRTEDKETTERKLVDSVWWTFRLSFGLVPFLAGLDKFFNLLTFWPKYVAPAFAGALPVTPQHFMSRRWKPRISDGWSGGLGSFAIAVGTGAISPAALERARSYAKDVMRQGM